MLGACDLYVTFLQDKWPPVTGLHWQVFIYNPDLVYMQLVLICANALAQVRKALDFMHYSFNDIKEGLL